MTTDILQEHKIIWEKKPALRAVYQDYYYRIVSQLKAGNTLEVGGGTGNLKNFIQHVTSTDILSTPWLDITCDAQMLPFKSNSFDNIVAVDVLHHIENPSYFFEEAERVLTKNGKFVLLEPAITPISWVFYHFFHPEPVILSDDPLTPKLNNPNRQAFDANQAIPELIFGKFLCQFKRQFPNLSLKKKSYLSFWVYPLSGGFRKWCLIPKPFIHFILNLENKIENFVGKLLGFRLLIVLQKS